MKEQQKEEREESVMEIICLQVSFDVQGGCQALVWNFPHFLLTGSLMQCMHAIRTPCISSSPHISHLQNINFYLIYIIIINHSETRNINPVDWSSRYVFSYRDRAWAWRSLEHFLKCLPSHTYVQLGLKALTLVLSPQSRVFWSESRMISNDWYKW